MERRDIFNLIVHHAREVLPALAKHSFEDSDRLAELGANSIDRAEIVVLVLESMALNVPRVELFGPRDVGELADLLHRKQHAG